MAVVAAVAYVNIHDQVTTRISLEYFVIEHSQIRPSASPTVLTLFWGEVASWWVGLPLGIALAFAARSGHAPKLNVQQLAVPLLKLLACMYAVVALAGLTGFLAAKLGIIQLQEPLASILPANRHTAFLVDGWAHAGSYLAGIVGGIAFCIHTARKRRRLASDGRYLSKFESQSQLH